MTVLNSVQIKLAEQLLLSVKNRESHIEYNELAARIDPPIHWRNVGKNIGEVSKLCHELGLPLLSAKVVSKGTQTAGQGFYPLYEMLGIPTEGKTEKELYHEERKAIRECKEWYKLEDYLGLNIGFERPEGAEIVTQTKPKEETVKAQGEKAAADATEPTEKRTVIRNSHPKEDWEDEALVNGLRADALNNVPATFCHKGTPKAKCAPIEINAHKSYPRDRQTAINALAHAGFCCEVDGTHPTFLRKNSEKPYTEPHHLVPMAHSDAFNVSLDVEENIVSLCCNCHKQIHYGQGAEQMIERLFSARKQNLHNVGINITLERLIEYYK